MINRLMMVCIMCVSVCICFAGEDTLMTLTTLTGEELTLRADGIWVPAHGQEVLFEKDFTVPISGGRFVLINTDGTWGFVKEELLYAEDLITTTKITSKGIVSNIDVTVATEKAKNKAFAGAVSKAKNAIKKIKKIDYKKVEECVRAVEKEVDVQETHSKSKGWTVQVLITLDKGSLLAVVECARKTEEEKAEKK